MNPQQSFLSMLGIARRAGKLVYGRDAVLEQVKKHQAVLLLLAGDLSERSQTSFLEAVKHSGLPCLQTPFSMDEFHTSVGRRSGIFAVCDRGFAQQFLSLSKQFSAS